MGDKANMAKRRGYPPVGGVPVNSGRSPTRKDLPGETKDNKIVYYKGPSNQSGGPESHEIDDYDPAMYYQQTNKHLLQGHHPVGANVNPGIIVEHGNSQRFSPPFPAGPGPGPGVQPGASFSMPSPHHGHPSNLSLGQQHLHSNLNRPTGVGLQPVGSNSVPGQPSSSIGRYPQNTIPTVPYPAPLHQMTSMRMPLNSNNGISGATSGLTPGSVPNNPRGTGGPNGMAVRPNLMPQNNRVNMNQPQQQPMSRTPGGPVNSNANSVNQIVNSSGSSGPSSTNPNNPGSAVASAVSASVSSVNSSNNPNSNPNISNNNMNNNTVVGPSSDVSNTNSDISNPSNQKTNLAVRGGNYSTVTNKVIHNANTTYGPNLAMKILDKSANSQDVPFDPSDFPALRSGLLNEGGGSGGHKSATQEFHIMNEDFPALPGSKDSTSASSSTTSNSPSSSTPSSSNPPSGTSSLNSSQDHKDGLSFQYVSKQSSISQSNNISQNNNNSSSSSSIPSTTPSSQTSSSVQSSDSLPSTFGHYYAASSHFPSSSSTSVSASSKQQPQQSQQQPPISQHISQHPHSHLSGPSGPSSGSQSSTSAVSATGGHGLPGVGGGHVLGGAQHQHSNFANMSQGNVSGYEYFNHLQRTGNNSSLNHPNSNNPNMGQIQPGQLNHNNSTPNLTNLNPNLNATNNSNSNPNLSSNQNNPGAGNNSINSNSSNSGGVGVKKGFSVPDRFGLLGILSVIRMTDPDLNTLASGVDLTTLGLNLNSPESLYPSFVSPFAEAPSRREPEFLLPHCYYVQPPLLPPRSKLGLLSDETIFYIFYSMPKDPLQADAATELYNRDWRYHKEHQRWFRRAPGTEPQVKTVAYERGSYIYFEYTSWEKIRKDNFILVYDALEAKRNDTTDQS